MVKKNFLKSSLIIALAVITALTVAVMLPNKVSAASNDSKTITLTYSAHMQTYGDGNVVKAGNEVTATPTSFAGVTGESKRMESLTMAFEGPTGVSLKYQAHVQGLGWTTEVPVTKEGTTFVGTKGQSKRVEAVKITVVGLDKLTNAGYEIRYRAHVQGIGWQDWVTADASEYNETERNFAGTKGESRRIEAIEIVVVHVHQKGEYTYNGETDDGVAQHTMICPLCKERIVEDCTYGEWTTSQDGTNVTRTCVCGHTETKKLQKVLNDEATTDVEVDKVNTTLTVPLNKTLTVDDKLESGAEITVKGTLILRGTTDSSAKLKGNGTVIWAPEAETETEFQTKCGNLANALKLSGGAVSDPKTSLKYEIRLPEMEEPQTILTTDDSDVITIGPNYNITLDLGKNELKLKPTASNVKGLIDNKANLTIQNGILTDDKTTGEISKYVLQNEATGKLTLENVTINTKNRAIGTIGDLTISNSTIKGTDNAYVAVKVGDLASAGPVTDNLSEKTISLDNVKIEGVENGLVTLAMNATVTLNDVDVVAKEFALTTNAYSPSKNNSYIVTGGSYKVTNENATVAYLASTGKSVFTDCTLEGANGIETSGTELTLDGATIKATGKTYWGTGIEMAKQGGPTQAGAAVLLRVCKNYGDKAGIKLLVKNSTLISTNGYAVNVAAGEELNDAVKNVSISYDTASYEELDGKCGPQYVADKLKEITTTHYDVVEG